MEHVEHHHHSHHEHHEHNGSESTRALAIGATLHCITGCSIGEVAGMIIGTMYGMSNSATIVLSVALSFVFGYLLSMLPLVKHGLPLRQALTVVLAADSLSILAMEMVDNAIMAIVPGALNADLVNPIFWLTLPLSLVAAFFVAVPVNQFLLERGRGHALVHKYHNH